MSRRRIFFLLLPLTLVLAAPARADVHPNTAPGFPAEQSFHVGDVDSVNLFNGGLTLTIPIGGSYPVNGGFSYRLKLVYNSNPWLFRTIHYQIPPDFHEVNRRQASPTPCSNAGLGWRVSLGRLNPPCQVVDPDNPAPNHPIYQDENGTDHVFYNVLHAGDAEDALPAGVSDVEYTRDGSYLRLKVYAAGFSEVELPDGSVRRFDAATGMPTSLRDPFGNSLSISYATANQWVLTDSQGRVQRIYFRTDLTPYAQTVDHIDLTSFAGTATYQFNYVSQTIGRPCPHNDTDQMGSVGGTIAVPLLTGVTLPDGSAWKIAATDYVTTLPPDGVCTENAGEITALRLPALGRMEWTWQKYTFPAGSSQKLSLQSNPGVATRGMRDPGGAIIGATSYPRYDSRGHLLRRIDGGNDLTFSYDPAERLVQVKETGGAQRLLKTFNFANANTTFTDPGTGIPCTDYRKGKISQQSRFNYVTVNGGAITVELREGLTYCGRDGRLSRRTLDNYVNGGATPNESFILPNVAYDALGNVTALGYPQCTHAACAAPSPRTVSFTYSDDLLSAVGIPSNAGSYASSISYHPNLMVNQVVHANGLTDTYANDPNLMARPAAITVTTPASGVRWSTGTYAYDGAGNVEAIGTHTFTYDKVSRLTAGNLYLEPTSATTFRNQTYTYDAFGNLLTIGGSSARNTPTAPATNHLTTATYDAAGNVATWNGNAYAYDPFHLMWDYRTPSDEWLYLYTADDERAWAYKTDNTSLWTLRGPGNKVLREYVNNGTWSVAEDYIYRSGLLLAAETPQGIRHFHLDHLGTPRLVSNSLGQQTAYHVYYPFGEEATAFNQDTIREKFTGHERDLGNPAGAGDDLDYMHARFFGPLTGRFLSLDVDTGKVKQPQSWNRYAYTYSNPLKNVDPDGKAALEAVVITAAAVAVTVAVAHAVRMQTDSQYRQRVMDGARRSAESATAVVSSILSKTTKKDPAERDYDIVGPLPTKENKGGGRGRFQDYEDAIDQLSGILEKQVRIRKGQAEGIIDSAEKSIDRLKNALKDIIEPKDADLEPKEVQDEKAKKEGAQRSPR